MSILTIQHFIQEVKQMETLHDPEVFLQHLQYPAFFVKNGCITAANTAAVQRFAEVGTEILPLLSTGKEAYTKLTDGTLYLTLQLCGTLYRCAVTVYEDGHLFRLEDAPANATLQALSLAAGQLSLPLSDLTILVNKQEPLTNEEQNRLNQQLYRLQRIIGNMADAADSVNHTPRMERCDLIAQLQELLEKSSHYLAQNQIKLDYQLPAQSVYAYADIEMIKRAVYNLISNAAKFSAEKKPISVRACVTGSVFSLTVQNYCAAVQQPAYADIFRRYERQPGLEDSKNGLGLGMTLIHSAAAAHGGTVLITQDQSGGIKFTFTVAVKSANDSSVRSPILRPDIYGGKDQALVELSDVLPASLYANR